MKKRIIFDNYDTDCEDIELWYDDEKSNLDKYLDNNIIALADLGLWNGRRTGYNILNNNLNSILNSFNCDYKQVWQDRYNVKSKCIHHDGTNYILFRMLRPGLSYDQLNNFEEKILTGLLTDRDLRKYTVSLNKFIDDIYGKVSWKGEN